METNCSWIFCFLVIVQFAKGLPIWMKFLCLSVMPRLSGMDSKESLQNLWSGNGWYGLCRAYLPELSNLHAVFYGRSMFHLNHSGKALVHEIEYDGEKRVLDDMPFFWRGYLNSHEFITGAVLIPYRCIPRNFTSEGLIKAFGLLRLFPRKLG